MKKIVPITPKEAKNNKRNHIPQYVIEAFNELIYENFDGKEASFTQDEVVSRIRKKRPCLKGKVLFEKNHLDVEGLYEDQGWSVYYDKPGYCESYDASFTFKVKK